MTFTVNQERRRAWNHGWWRDWTQGRVAIVMACVCVTGLAALAVFAALTLDPTALAAETRELGNRPETMRLAALLVVAGALLTGASVAIGGVLRHRREPERQLTNETLSIKDGILTLYYHRRYDPVRDGIDVACARLDKCSFWWDAKRRQLVIDAEETGAVREWHYGRRTGFLSFLKTSHISEFSQVNRVVPILPLKPKWQIHSYMSGYFSRSS